MIKKQGDKWLAKCELCSWSMEKNTEKEAQEEYNRHLDLVHKKPQMNITEKRSPVPANEKQGNLPEAQKPQGITKKDL